LNGDIPAFPVRIDYVRIRSNSGGNVNRQIGFIGLIAFFSFLPLATAQPLADRIPADAIVYVGWAGADSMGPGFEASHLKAMLEAAEVPRVIREVIPKLMERLGQQQPQAAGIASLAQPILTPMWKHPTALYIGPVELKDQGPPMPNAAILCDAGEDAAAMKEQITNLLQQAGGNMPFPIAVRESGSVIAIVIGNPPGLDAVLGGKSKAEALAGVKSFSGAMSKQTSPVIAAYIDAEALLKLVNEAVTKFGPPEANEKWSAARDALGLSGIRRLSFTQGFDGKDWSTRAFIEAPAPRKGVIAGFDATPVTDDLLRSIPVSATVMGVGRADLGGLFDAIQSGLVQLDANASQEFDKGMKEVNEKLGLDLRQDILGPLGDEWAYYIAPDITGRGPFGMVVINRLKEAEKAQSGLDKLKERANELIAEEADKDVKISFKSAKIGSGTIDYLATPFASPSWTIQNGNLYAGLFPQVVAGATTKRGKSILDNPDFVALRKRLGAERASSIQFYDLPRSAPTSYQIWLFTSSFAKLGDIVGVDTPMMLLPPLQTMMQHLSVAGSASWVDDTGWHFRAISPFPGATAIASETAGSMDVQTTALMVSILLPSLNRAREQANRIKSASNLRQIGLSAHMYANENKGAFPEDLAATSSDLTIDVYLNPRSGTARPEGLEGEALKTWINESSDYIWIGKGKTFQAAADVPLAYERPDGLQDGLNILFADGHVEWQSMPQATQTIEGGKGKDGNAPPDGL
jgi:prepilin-type processing-associated H-X9-DG protein